MHIHFYTNQANLDLLIKGEQATVWKESKRSPTDHHISINPSECHVQITNNAKTLFYISEIKEEK